ncbi:magnesium chelatase, subunit ChlI [Candidatus Methanoplasma termitum]|uniref:Magnesium chelatase, subunit ChlI n=1 Tax=Candidatus Methanoplasma termitum TaxID=1577791 RepID=A0A0A7LC08_9ARCH|nr:ATP-binding protein [Candidatus Methanoplasma termitum]AIZ56700.1 magnesium chelatase, subunit ChlI [Candidatus Methanoplasma termitum]
MSKEKKLLFPFAAIVGQEQMKAALLLNVVDPGIGGVLIRGEKGTAKSTTVRSLAQVLPEVEHVKDCIYRCDPKSGKGLCPNCAEAVASGKKLESETSHMRVVELPLSATEDRIAGTLDIEHVLQTGKKKFEPGVLAQANGNLLYVDEVNLLEDHMVDLLLDAAAMGVNYVEREGISFEHPSKFILVGSMNPEEGEIRPQLLDRFGLCVEIRGEKDLSTRTEIIGRRLAFDADPKGFTRSYADETKKIKDSILNARKILANSKADKELISMAARVALFFDMEGHRADITMVRAAKANAALNGRAEAGKMDIATVAPMVLTHRMKRKPFEETGFDDGELIACLQDI